MFHSDFSYSASTTVLCLLQNVGFANAIHWGETRPFFNGRIFIAKTSTALWHDSSRIRFWFWTENKWSLDDNLSNYQKWPDPRALCFTRKASSWMKQPRFSCSEVLFSDKSSLGTEQTGAFLYSDHTIQPSQAHNDGNGTCVLTFSSSQEAVAFRQLIDTSAGQSVVEGRIWPLMHLTETIPLATS